MLKVKQFFNISITEYENSATVINYILPDDLLLKPVNTMNEEEKLKMVRFSATVMSIRVAYEHLNQPYKFLLNGEKKLTWSPDQPKTPEVNGQ